MTAIVLLAALLALLSLRLYLRNLRLIARLRRARSRCAQLRARLAEAERFAGATLIRSVKRRAALVRVARHCRAMGVTLDAAIEVGIQLGHQVCDRDEAIDAMTARIAELMPRETSASIAAWADATFGPVESNMSIWKRADEEFQELRLKLAEDDSHPRAAEESADVCIVLDRLVHRLGCDMAQERQRKMATNRARRWKPTGDGHGQHVEEPAP